MAIPLEPCLPRLRGTDTVTQLHCLVSPQSHCFSLDLALSQPLLSHIRGEGFASDKVVLFHFQRMFQSGVTEKPSEDSLPKEDSY